MNTRNKKVPLRWLSLEAMRDHLYSSKSDVWAFGIVLWEIGTLGGFPYPTVSNHDLLAFLLDGQRLERPANCSEHLYRLMLACWSEAADDRPAFADIVQHLEPTNGRRVYVDFNELSRDYTFPPTREQVLQLGPMAADTCGGGSEPNRFLMSMRLAASRRRSTDTATHTEKGS